MLDSASERNLEEDDFSNVNVVISTTGVVGELSMHNDPIGVTSVMADTAMPPIATCMAMPPIDAANLAQYGTIQTGVPVSSVMTQATPSTAGSAGVAAYTAKYGIIMPQYIVSAPAHGGSYSH